MKHLLYGACGCLLLLSTATAGMSAEVPDWIPAAPDAGPSPIWMSVQNATDSRGEIRSELFDPVAKMNLERQVEQARKAKGEAGLRQKANGERCHSWIFVPPSPVVDELTLENLLDHARLAFIGTVEDQDQGFYHGHPNSLLEIRVDKVLKAPEGQEEITSVLATFPHVEMEIGGEMVCMRSDRYPERPITGKRIMIFAANIPDTDPLVVAPNTEVVLFEDEAGKAVLPGRFGNVIDPPSWSSLVERTLELTGNTPRGGSR